VTWYLQGRYRNLITRCASFSEQGAGAAVPDGVWGIPLWRQLNSFLLPAEGAGRRLASLPGLRGVPEKLFLLFLRAPQAARRRGESWGTAPSPRWRAAALNNSASVDAYGGIPNPFSSSGRRRRHSEKKTCTWRLIVHGHPALQL